MICGYTSSIVYKISFSVPFLTLKYNISYKKCIERFSSKNLIGNKKRNIFGTSINTYTINWFWTIMYNYQNFVNTPILSWYTDKIVFPKKQPDTINMYIHTRCSPWYFTWVLGFGILQETCMHKNSTRHKQINRT